MKKVIFFLVSYILGHSLVFAQKHDVHWILGTGIANPVGYACPMAFDFTDSNFSLTQPPPRPITIDRASVTMSDAEGNLLFYTNGYQVGNAQNQVMQNGDSLQTQDHPEYYPYGFPYPGELMALPRPQHVNQYLLFYLYHLWGDQFPAHQFLYSEIDMTLDSGKGAVTAKNKTLINMGNDTLANMSTAAVKHGNGRDWWVVIPEHSAQQLYTLLVTPNSIEGPFLNEINDVRHHYCLFATFTPDGSKYIQFIDDNNYPGQVVGLKYIRILDFDRCTGTFSNMKLIPSPFFTFDGGCVGGLTVSPNSRFLYQATADTLFQFDLWATNIETSRTVVAVNDSFQSIYTGQFTKFFIPQLAPDGKIYIATSSSTSYMHIIHNPDNQGLACNVEQHFALPCILDQGLPLYPNYRLGAKIGSACDTLALSNEEGIGKSEKVKVYPNPAQSYVQVELPQGEREATFVLRNALGQVVQQTHLQASMLVQLGNVAKGLYFYEVIFKAGKSHGKLQVE